MKSKTTALILWLLWLVGLGGLHRIYLGKVGTGILWLLTWGVFGIGQIIDLFTLGTQVDLCNTMNNKTRG
jgi:TM2 domain-containing membrane protein YozV